MYMCDGVILMVEKTDIYSLSLVLWEIMAGLPPFEEIASLDLHHQIVKEHRRPELPYECPPQLARLMQRGTVTHSSVTF
jgi:hypothetical protein